MCIQVMSVHMCMLAPTEATRGCWKWSYELPCGCWESSVGPLGRTSALNHWAFSGPCFFCLTVTQASLEFEIFQPQPPEHCIYGRDPPCLDRGSDITTFSIAGMEVPTPTSREKCCGTFMELLSFTLGQEALWPKSLNCDGNDLRA